MQFENLSFRISILSKMFILNEEKHTEKPDKCRFWCKLLIYTYITSKTCFADSAHSSKFRHQRWKLQFSFENYKSPAINVSTPTLCLFLPCSKIPLCWQSGCLPWHVVHGHLLVPNKNSVVYRICPQVLREKGVREAVPLTWTLHSARRGSNSL